MAAKYMLCSFKTCPWVQRAAIVLEAKKIKYEITYIEQERSVHDKRSIRVKLSSKGKETYKLLADMFKKHEEKIKGTELSDERMNESIKTMKMFERFWSSQSQFTGLASLDDEE